MVRLNKCGHPVEWSIRLVGAGLRFTYCLGCLIEATGLKNLEGLENKYIKHEQNGIRPGMMSQTTANAMRDAKVEKEAVKTEVKIDAPKEKPKKK